VVFGGGPCVFLAHVEPYSLVDCSSRSGCPSAALPAGYSTVLDELSYFNYCCPAEAFYFVFIQYII
jgi:hypothetical protein